MPFIPQQYLSKIHRCKKEKELSSYQKLKEKNVQTTDFDKNIFNCNHTRWPYLDFSYNISSMIFKSRKPHTIDVELIILVICNVIRTVLHKPTSCIIKIQSLTLQRRFNEIAQDVEDSLCGNLNSFQFSTQICKEIELYVQHKDGSQKEKKTYLLMTCKLILLKKK